MESATFSITWDGSGGEVRLMWLLDNGKFVPLDGLQQELGKVSITYKAAPASIHLMEWSLLFPTQTLKNLKATRQGAQLAVAPELTTSWPGRGTV